MYITISHLILLESRKRDRDHLTTGSFSWQAEARAESGQSQEPPFNLTPTQVAGTQTLYHLPPARVLMSRKLAPYAEHGPETLVYGNPENHLNGGTRWLLQQVSPLTRNMVLVVKHFCTDRGLAEN